MAARRHFACCTGGIRAVTGPRCGLLERYWRGKPAGRGGFRGPEFQSRAVPLVSPRAFPAGRSSPLLTDIADYPPHFWIEQQKQFVICGSERAAEQARRMGHEESRIFKTSGMILNPRFYGYRQIDRERERQALGLDPRRVTGLVLFGSQGSKRQMIEIDQPPPAAPAFRCS